MNVLTRKDVKWRWEGEEQTAFDELKKAFTMWPVLAAPDLDKEFRVEADCYESPKKEWVSHAFKHLVINIKSYNADKDINSMGT